MKAMTIYRAGNFFYKHNLRLISKIFDFLSYFLHNSYIPSSCEMGKNTKFAYGGIGLVIHSRAYIGAHCMIGQWITIGGKSGSLGVPIIEDNVYIGPGAKILGNFTVGHDSIIGTNAVVMKNVEPYSMVADVPAKLITKINKQNFESKYKYYYGPLNGL